MLRLDLTYDEALALYVAADGEEGAETAVEKLVAVIERADEKRSRKVQKRTCRDCGLEFVAPSRRGRPPVRCLECDERFRGRKVSRTPEPKPPLPPEETQRRAIRALQLARIARADARRNRDDCIERNRETLELLLASGRGSAESREALERMLGEEELLDEL